MQKPARKLGIDRLSRQYGVECDKEQHGKCRQSVNGVTPAAFYIVLHKREHTAQRKREKYCRGEVVILKGCAPDENPGQKLRKITDDDKLRSSVTML